MNDKNTLERELESKLVKEIKKRGGQCLKWVSPGAAGVPDRIVILPDGFVYFVELKRPKGGKQAELQKYWARQLTNLGHEHAWVTTHEQLAALLNHIDDMQKRLDEVVAALFN